MQRTLQHVVSIFSSIIPRYALCNACITLGKHSLFAPTRCHSVFSWLQLVCLKPSDELESNLLKAGLYREEL